MSTRRRQSGSIRRLPSGKYQARVRDLASGDRIPLGTFRTKADADLAVKNAELEIARGSWTDPKRAELPFVDFPTAWLSDRPALAPRTREIYAGLLKNHIGPTFNDVPLKSISPAM